MRRLFYALVMIILVPSCSWLMTGDFLLAKNGYFAFRSAFTQYSGLLAFIAMSLCVILAARFAILEKLFHGLDKEYRLHKWLGIMALSCALFHFILAKGTKWAVGWGWLIKPVRNGANTIEKGALETLFSSWRGWAEFTGEWVFYGAVILIVAALVKAVPYHIFAKFHKVLALGYLGLVAHSVILLKFSYWTTPLGLIMAACATFGSIAAIMALFNRIGKKRQVDAVVQNVNFYDDVATLRIDALVGAQWPGHKAGQFAFIRFDDGEDAHPFTIASGWQQDEKTLTFAIKALGDYTAKLRDRVVPGSKIRIEGPYGCFDFSDIAMRQIWIGAGIGVTPFLAALDERVTNDERVKTNKEKAEIDFFYCTQKVTPNLADTLQQAAKQAGIRLYIVEESRDGFLSGEKLRAQVQNWQQSSVWFCGPLRFAKALQDDFKRHGGKMQHFHRELFEMR